MIDLRKADAEKVTKKIRPLKEVLPIGMELVINVAKRAESGREYSYSATIPTELSERLKTVLDENEDEPDK